MSKREFFCGVAQVPVLLSVKKKAARAIGEGPERMILSQPPKAPLAALVPAMEQRLLLEVALQSCQQEDCIKLKSIVPPFDDNNRYRNSQGRDNRRILQSYDTSQVLRGDLVRASMNLYQTNLNYNDALSATQAPFQVTDPAWKKSYIRTNDGLPDLQQVIGADLDLRLLLRNQVQEKLEDAAAELYAVNSDAIEVQRCLQEARDAFDRWIDRIPAAEVTAALQAIQNGKAIRVLDSSAAGFLPPS